jgi:hypothetical protein
VFVFLFSFFLLLCFQPFRVVALCVNRVRKEGRKGKGRKGKDGLRPSVRIATKDLFLRASFSYFPQFGSVSGAWKVKSAKDSRALSQGFGRSGEVTEGRNTEFLL